MTVEWDGSGVVRHYSILSLKEILKAKLSAFFHRESRNDFLDLMWMCGNLAARVRAVSGRLDQDQREFFLVALSESGSASLDQIDGVRHALDL